MEPRFLTNKMENKIKTIGFLMFLLGIFLFLSLLSNETLPNGLINSSGGYNECYFDYNLNQSSTNIMGRLGENFNCYLRYKGFGIMSLLIPVIFILWGFVLISKINKKKLKDNFLRSVYLLVSMIIFSIIISSFTSMPAWSGILAINLNAWLTNLIGFFGLWLIIFIIFISYICFLLGIPAHSVMLGFKKYFFLILPKFGDFFKFIFNKIKFTKYPENLKSTEKNINQNKFTETTKEVPSPQDSKIEPESNPSLEFIKGSEEKKFNQEQETNIEENLDSFKNENNLASITDMQEVESVNIDKIKERKSSLFSYKLPKSDLLDSPELVKMDVSEEVLRARGMELVDALASFGVKGEIIQIKKGPVITLYEIEPAEGVRVNKFTNLSDDLARVMKAQRIRVLAPIPGTKYIGIELPNDSPQIVYLKSILNSKKYAESKSKLTIGVGKTTMGNEFCFDLQKMPHLLVAGATGAGKSVCINTIIVSILYKAKPDEVKFILIDPKKLELATYKSLVGYHLITAPDLDEYVMTTAENAVGILDSAITEMERRFEIFAQARVRNIQEYHSKQQNSDELEKIPYIVVLIDELADLMMTSGRAVEDPITRLAQKARAVGIHLVVATQRPSVDVITGLIKSNFPARISFQVSSKIDSRTILDQMGAETLLGRGDMLFLPPGSASPIRLHNAFITLEEIEKIMNHIVSQAKPDELLLPETKKETLESEFDISDDRDELLFDAAKLVINNQQASVSMLQRRFKIGYSRAGRLIDELEALGIVSGYSGSKARDVLVDDSYIQKIFN